MKIDELDIILNPLEDKRTDKLVLRRDVGPSHQYWYINVINTSICVVYIMPLFSKITIENNILIIDSAIAIDLGQFK